MIQNDVTNTFHIHFKAYIYDNEEDDQFRNQLDQLGIEITNVINKRILEVNLPDRWLPIQMDDDVTMIVDEKGRGRIRCHQPTEISIVLPRYSGEIEILTDDVTGYRIGMLRVMDAGSMQGESIIEPDNMAQIMTKVGYDIDQLYYRLEEELNELINEEYPGYTNPLLYW
ncbi:hypothetical protein D3C73_1205020 [compost metagenome]